MYLDRIIIQKFTKIVTSFVYNMALITVLLSCSSVPEINISLDELVEPDSKDKKTLESASSIEARIEELKKHLQSSSDEKLMEDVILMLEARKKFYQNDFTEAQNLWIKSLEKSKYQTSVNAFWGLVQTISKSQNDTSLSGISSKIYSLLKDKDIYFLKDRKIGSEEKLKAYIEQNQLSYNIELSLEDGSKDLETFSQDKTGEIDFFDTKKDPYLKQALKRYCKTGRDRKTEELISEEEKKLDSFYKIYWKGLKSECDKKIDDSIKAFSYILTKYVDDRSPNILPAVALNSGVHLVNLYKLKGNRVLMSYSWSAIVKIYEMGISPKDLNMPGATFELQKIDYYLWASRYLAIVHDYTAATKTVNKALSFIKELQKTKLSVKDRKQADVFEAEAYSVLASRILVEEKKYKEAIGYIGLIRQISSLPTSWKERIDWNEALYTYLDGNYPQAISMLDKLLSNPNYKSNESRYLYWMYKLNLLVDNQDEASFYYNQLIDQYPFSFYSVYSAYDKKNSHLSEYLTYSNSLKSYYLDSSEYKLILDGKAKALLKRHELILLSSLTDFYESSSMEFYSYFKKKYKLSAKSFEDYLFIAKLLTASGNYIHSISLITELVKFDKNFWKSHPEYIFVYYPRPYMDIYVREAKKRGFNESVPLAISRQESSFRTQVKSSAGAIGIMQMMPETGIKMYKKLHDLVVEDSKMEKLLKEAGINIELGTYYLYTLYKRYDNNLSAVFGGYNAGEYMIDAWLDHRYHKDVITWIEMIPFNETKDYIKNVWRNMMLYESIFAVEKQEPTVFDIEEY